MQVSAPRYFAALDWMAAGIAVLLAMLVYVITLAPTVTLEYSGALVVAAEHLGVARPPGYPVWTLLAKGFICLFPFAEYQGHPNPAWAVNLMSAAFGALACGLLALLTCRLSRENVPGHFRYINALCATTGITAALLFAFSPAMWSQSVIAETHTLTNVYFLGLLALSLRWMSLRDNKTPYLLAFLAGLGLAISPMLILFLPIILVTASFVSKIDFARMTAAALLFCGFLFSELIWGPVRAGFANGVLAIAILVATLLLALLLVAFRPLRPVGLLLLLLLAGLIPYIYLPLASDHNPPMNMGYARTWEGFWHVIMRGQYEALAPLNPFAEPMAFFRDLAWYFRLTAAQFTAPIVALALVPALALPWMTRKAQPALILVFAALGIFAVVVLIGANPQPDVQNTVIGRVIFIPSFALLALLAGLGFNYLLIMGTTRWAK